MRQTRIIATLGPSSATPTGVPALIAAGVDIFRLNFSHGTHEEHAEAARLVRAGAAAAGRHVAILQDLSGPKIRTGRLAGGTPIALPASAITEKDIADLQFGASLDVDMVALSFVQTAEDLQRTRAALAAAGARGTRLIAKIERPQAVDNLAAILPHCDGVMVARGDLGNEVPLYSVPRAQKEITRLAQQAGTPVIVATQVLESMRTNPRPTRAEVSDAANAVDDSVDAVMLSGETASGRYPVESVKMLDAVIRDAESLAVAPRAAFNAGVLGVPHNRAICEAALTLARAGAAASIVAVTREGKTARVLSALRPAAPIHAVTFDERVARSLMLHRGIEPIAVDRSLVDNPEGIDIERHLVQRGVLRSGETIVFVSIAADLTRADANFLRIRRVG